MTTQIRRLPSRPGWRPWLAGTTGYATRAELNAAGLTDPAIYSRTRRGRLHRRHPEVYAIGYPRTEPIALAAAAVLAGGPGAALSHGSAAALWALRRDWPDLPEVTIRGDRRSSDVRWHHSKTLTARELRIHHGIRTTSAARTLLDLAPDLTDRELVRAVSDARIARRAYEAELLELTARLPTHPGATRLRAQSRTSPGRPARTSSATSSPSSAITASPSRGSTRMWPGSRSTLCSPPSG